MPKHNRDKRHQRFYFRGAMLDEIAAGALRLNRSLSWVVQRAREIARKKIQKMPRA